MLADGIVLYDVLYDEKTSLEVNGATSIYY